MVDIAAPVSTSGVGGFVQESVVSNLAAHLLKLGAVSPFSADWWDFIYLVDDIDCTVLFIMYHIWLVEF